MEASALSHASQRGLLARRSPLLKLQGDAKLIAMARDGNTGAFETIVDRYQGRLLGFCRQMLGSTEDAEDVLQEVFVNAYRAMLADDREINLRPWLYRIARNRCLNHLRKPTADAQESMDTVPAVEASSTAERVHNREEFRQILSDVNKLPETQRSALLLREMDAMSYEEIALAMETSVPSVKSLLVRARISLTEASQARQLTCGEVRLELAEAAEGLRKVSGPIRRHVRDCEECADFRSQVRNNNKALAALFPVGPLLALKGFIAGKLGLGGAGAGAGAGGSAAGAAAGTAGTAGAVGSVSAALGGGSAAGGIGAVGSAIGAKAVASVVTAAVLTAGAVEVKEQTSSTPVTPTAKISQTHQSTQPSLAPAQSAEARVHVHPTPPVATPAPESQEAPVAAPPAEEPPAPAPAETATSESAGQSNVSTEAVETVATAVTGAAPSAGSGSGAHGTGSTVVVTVGGSTPPPASSNPPATSAPPAESPPPSTEPSPAEPSESSGGSTSGSSEAPAPEAEPAP
ncbi:MAG TPA: RNA polymerase sigma factor [Solirubrobacterales bacterium]|nr:RNA polymerase sigma factor [Solirubrobacterales bacterium]